MTVDVFVSELPRSVPLTNVSGERLSRDGMRCGESILVDKRGVDITIRHCLPPIRASAWAGMPTWNDVARQILSISAYDGAERIGSLLMRRYNAAEGRMAHAIVWCATSVDVLEPYRRRGIASAMYRHALVHGYPVGPAPAIRGDGKALWVGMDPTLIFESEPDGSFRPIGQKPRVPVPPHREDEDGLARISDYFRPNPTLADALVTSPERLLEDNITRNMFEDLTDLARPVLWNTTDLLKNLARLVSRAQDEEGNIGRAFMQWRLGRPRPEQLSFWRRYLPGAWQRRNEFLRKAVEISSRIREMIEEDDGSFQDCPACRDHIDMGLPSRSMVSGWANRVGKIAKDT